MDSALIGQVLALLSAVSFACSNVFIGQGSKANRNVDSGVAFSVFVTMVFALVVWLFLEGGQIPSTPSGNQQLGIIWFALAGVAALVLGRSLIYTSIKTIGIIRASAVRRLNPFFSVILAFIILGEAINLMGLSGMILVGVAVGALVAKPLLLGMERGDAEQTPPAFSYGWGVAAALAYSVSYLFRKFGLVEIGAPAFGTLISAVAGLLCYLALALIIPRYRRAIAGMFSQVNPQLIAAGVLVSIGQLLLFAALFYERIAVVAVIASLEMFFSTFLAVLLRAEKRPDRFTVVAGFVAMVGVILLALSSEA